MGIFELVKALRAWAEIDLDALAGNLALIRERVGPEVAILFVAKADAYGHGAVHVARRAFEAGVDAIGVATCAEALELRQAGIRGRIVVLGAVFEEEAGPAIELGVELVLPSVHLGRVMEDVARRAATPARVHVKTDTGMNRLGASAEETLALLAAVRRSRWLELAGLMTHVAATEGASPATSRQLARFAAVLEAGAPALSGRRAVWRHVANSACILSGIEPIYDAVRPGIIAYGISPHPSLPARIGGGELTPVMSVRTRIVQLKDVEQGARVGYGGSWHAARATRIATVPVGYDDGLDRRLEGRGEVLVRGRRVPIVGRISMDYASLDVTAVPDACFGDRVTWIGADGGERIRVEELAARIGTIPYEVVCSVGRRVTRVSVEAGSVLQPHPPRAHRAPDERSGRPVWAAERP